MIKPSRGNCIPWNVTHIDGTLLDNVNSTKYLGVHLTSTLSWHDHISGVCSKLGRGLYLIRKLRCILNTNELIIVYKTLIQSHIDYGITIYGYAPSTYIQNRMIRLITGDYSWESSPRNMLNQFHVPNVLQRRDYFSGIYVYKSLNDQFPSYMSDLLHHVNEYNMYSTRNNVESKLYIFLNLIYKYIVNFSNMLLQSFTINCLLI